MNLMIHMIQESLFANIYKKCLSLAKIRESGLTEERYQTIAYEMQSKDYLNDVNRLDVFDKQCFNGICHDFGIFCLTPDPVNVLMWSYYGDSHRGFSIGYSTAYLVKSGLFGMGGQFFMMMLFQQSHYFIQKLIIRY